MDVLLFWPLTVVPPSLRHYLTLTQRRAPSRQAKQVSPLSEPFLLGKPPETFWKDRPKYCRVTMVRVVPTYYTHQDLECRQYWAVPLDEREASALVIYEEDNSSPGQLLGPSQTCYPNWKHFRLTNHLSLAYSSYPGIHCFLRELRSKALAATPGLHQDSSD